VTSYFSPVSSQPCIGYSFLDPVESHLVRYRSAFSPLDTPLKTSGPPQRRSNYSVITLSLKLWCTSPSGLGNSKVWLLLPLTMAKNGTWLFLLNTSYRVCKIWARYDLCKWDQQI
jgi:hypothetical protein